METLCVMESVSRLNGGVFESERSLQRELAREPDYKVRVVGLRDQFSDVDSKEWAPLTPVTCAVQGPNAFGFSTELAKFLSETESDLAYCAGLWKYPSWAVLRWAKQTRHPMIVAPHGMLDAWALRNSMFKKMIAGWLYQTAQLKRAVCLRALCRSEAQSIRAYGLENPVCIIPNGVDLPEPQNGRPVSAQPPFANFKKEGKKVLLYLGRLHPKKGIANLIKSWALLRSSRSSVGDVPSDQWVLVIAGWDQGSYERELRRQTADNGTANSILFLGPRFNEEKAACFRNCDAFVLPSYSEGLPTVVLEAWSHGKPVLMTPQCNLPEGFAADAAIRVETKSESIQQGIRTLLEMSAADRRAMGQRGLKLISEHFTWSKIASQMRDLCMWASGGGPKPSTAEYYP
jgi:glycosyltransferase involved in cell wall biosynthesis